MNPCIGEPFDHDPSTHCRLWMAPILVQLEHYSDEAKRQAIKNFRPSNDVVTFTAFESNKFRLELLMLPLLPFLANNLFSFPICLGENFIATVEPEERACSVVPAVLAFIQLRLKPFKEFCIPSTIGFPSKLVFCHNSFHPTIPIWLHKIFFFGQFCSFLWASWFSTYTYNSQTSYHNYSTAKWTPSLQITSETQIINLRHIVNIRRF